MARPTIDSIRCLDGPPCYSWPCARLIPKDVIDRMSLEEQLAVYKQIVEETQYLVDKYSGNKNTPLSLS